MAVVTQLHERLGRCRPDCLVVVLDLQLRALALEDRLQERALAEERLVVGADHVLLRRRHLAAGRDKQAGLLPELAGQRLRLVLAGVEAAAREIVEGRAIVQRDVHQRQAPASLEKTVRRRALTVGQTRLRLPESQRPETHFTGSTMISTTPPPPAVAGSPTTSTIAPSMVRRQRPSLSSENIGDRHADTLSASPCMVSSSAGRSAPPG